jgi:hypothetical protein
MRNKILDEPKELINYSYAYQIRNLHHPVQVDVINEKDYREFLTFCHALAEYEFIDELSGGGARKRSSTLKFEDVIHKSDTGIRCGMKINHFPQYRMDIWETWQGGYIECFIRMDSETKGNEWFIWQYIRMNHLETILKRFPTRLSWFDMPL